MGGSVAKHLVATEIEPSECRTRQNLRACGYDETIRRIREMFPKTNRKELRELARKLHKKAWNKREADAVRNLMQRGEKDGD